MTLCGLIMATDVRPEQSVFLLLPTCVLHGVEYRKIAEGMSTRIASAKHLICTV